MRILRTARGALLLAGLLLILLLSGCNWWDGDDDPSTGPTPPAAPSAAPILTAGNGQLTVAWPPVGGAASYEVWYGSTDNSASATRFTGDADATDNGCILTGLANGTAVYVWLKAVNAGGTSGFSPAGSATPVAPAYTVDAANGNDLTGDGVTVPYKTIRKALSQAAYGDTVTVAPGTYDRALGEDFPIVIPAGVRLVGDEANKGNGTVPTQIVGGGVVVDAYFAAGLISAAVIPSDNTTLSGFVVYNDNASAATFRGGIVGKGDNVALTNLRITSHHHDAIYTFGGGASSVISGNVVRNNDHGIVFREAAGGGVRVEGNVVTGNQYGVEYDELTPSGDLGGGANGSAGGNVLAGNTEINLWTNCANTVTISARNNSWGHVPPTTTTSTGASGYDIFNQYGATIDTTGAALAP